MICAGIERRTWPRAYVALPLGRRNSSDQMTSASAPARELSVMYASSLMPGIIIVHAMICSRSSEYRLTKASRQEAADAADVAYFGTAGRESGPPAGSKFAKRRTREPDPRVSRKQLECHEDPSLASHDPTRPVKFET